MSYSLTVRHIPTRLLLLYLWKQAINYVRAKTWLKALKSIYISKIFEIFSSIIRGLLCVPHLGWLCTIKVIINTFTD